MANTNKTQHKAKAEKNPEFYTLKEDIENELSMYDFEQFKNKVVYCNCDDPTWSNFFKFFTKWGKKMGIKEVHFTNYANGKRQFKQMTLFEKDDLIESVADDKKGTAHHWIFTPETNKIIKKELKGNGDFRSDECIEILKKCDIVVTNPPFHLFREFVSLITEQYNKLCLIIGNQNAISYKEIFKLIKDNKLWLGNHYHLTGFILPDGSKLDKSNQACRQSAWFTNLDVARRNEPMILHPQDLSQFKTYFNFDALEIPETKLIPENYFGNMGVPITFLQKYCPMQFEIVGQGIANLGLEIGVKPYTAEHRKYRKEVQRRGTVDGDLYMIIDNEVVVPYARIIIKRKKHYDEL